MSDAVPAPPAMSSSARWFAVAAVMLATIMVILDMTIVNVALPQMMAALGATSDQVTWVLTAYIVAEAIVIPISGFLSLRFGRKRLMLVSIVGFVIASALSGQAGSLSEMVLFRIVQGAFGASVVPLSQSIMVDSFGEHDRGRAMAIWGIGIMLGPVLGPTLGGYITQHLEWRWVFYINVPVGIANAAMIYWFLAETKRHRIGADWLGAIVMAVGIGSLQIVLDRGNQEQWFDSTTIVLLSLIAVMALAVFVRRALTRPDSILDLRLLRDRNLAAASVIMFAFGLGLFGTIALQPIMLERLFGYPAGLTGLVLAPRALASATGMFAVAALITRIDARWIILAGLAFATTGTYIMTGYTPAVSPAWIVWPGAIQGLGMGMIFVPLSTLAYRTLPPGKTDQGSSIYNLSRTIGASVGISIAVTVLTRMTQTTWNGIGGHITVFRPELYTWLATRNITLDNPLAAQFLGQELNRQALMLGFVDAFYVIALSFIVLAPLVLLLRGRNDTSRGPAAGSDKAR